MAFAQSQVVGFCLVISMLKGDLKEKSSGAAFIGKAQGDSTVGVISGSFFSL